MASIEELEARNQALMAEAKAAAKAEYESYRAIVFGALPSLEGSEKQVAWMVPVRARYQAYLQKRFPAFDESSLHGIGTLGMARAKRYARDLSQKKAAWWIENRFGLAVTTAENNAILYGPKK